ncbi:MULTISPECIES: permease-like cell division protein FtsX [unclassified Butyrivibrio]|uniref:permease-like cell division protein FtsX n=1 Tax=unclassified Butyrivibrio TaxID=2639466 RepID=UPI0003B54028|nr:MULTISPECIES: permease-like cell division protein FtsX [unclassified Butyrivibrio]MDC7292903.1 permease-like cell division protein FtsX [Butyrivibrio sp. DSM 10294]
MRISSFFYTIGQGFKNLGRNKWYTLASVATISACLFLFGIFYSIITNFQNVVKTAEEGVSVTVFFNEGTSEEEILAVKSDLEKRSEVREIDYVSADAAWEGFKEEYLGEYADGFTENPLADSANLQIYLNDVSMQQALVTYIESITLVREVNRSEVTATTLSGINKLIAYVSAGIILILLLVSIFLISNTVTMGISVRKDEINIMKYIGATDFFVRAPFVVEGILIGIIGSLIPLVIIYFVYTHAIEYVISKFTVLSSLLKFLPVGVIFNKLTPISLIIGIGIGFFGSFVTVRRHLHV